METHQFTSGALPQVRSLHGAEWGAQGPALLSTTPLPTFTLTLAYLEFRFLGEGEKWSFRAEDR